MKTPDISETIEFLQHSNWIERETSLTSLDDAMTAWSFAMTLELLQVRDFIEVHRLLMSNIRPDIAGKYRTCDVWIGGVKKKYLGSAVLESQLIDVANFIISSFKLSTDSEREEACREAHVMFENVHPFEDGNGRTGRIIYNWHRLRLGLPLHIIHEGEEQYAYYAWFKR